MAWEDIESIHCDVTPYSLNSLPLGTTVEYQLRYRMPDSTVLGQWALNTTYEGVTQLSQVIAERAEVTITGADPHSRF